MQIHEVMKKTGISKKALQYYEDKKLIHVQKDTSGYRVYDEEQIAILWNIKVLRKLDFSIAEIEHILLGEDCEAIFQKHFNEIDKRMAQCDIQKGYMKGLYENLTKELDVQYLQEMDHFIHEDMELHENIQVNIKGCQKKYHRLNKFLCLIGILISFMLMQDEYPVLVGGCGFVLFLISLLGFNYFTTQPVTIFDSTVHVGIAKVKSTFCKRREK